MRFAVAECSLGAILVAQTAKGVCAILLGDDPSCARSRLQDRFPRAACVGGDPSSSAGDAGGRLRRSAGDRPRFAARRARHRLSAARVAGAARDSGRFDGELPRDCRPYRRAARRAGGGAGVRGESAGGRGAVSSGGADRWRSPVIDGASPASARCSIGKRGWHESRERPRTRRGRRPGGRCGGHRGGREPPGSAPTTGRRLSANSRRLRLGDAARIVGRRRLRASRRSTSRIDCSGAVW